MRRTMAAAVFLLLCTLATPLAAQQTNNQCTKETDQQTTSGASGTLTFPDTCGTRVNTFEMKVTGAPTGVTVAINGCMRGGTCSALTTTTSTSNAVLTTIGGPYDNYQITFTLTGGASPALTFNRTAAPGAVSNTSLTAWFYASSFATSTTWNSDYCLLMNNAVTAIGAGPTPSALLVWDIPGKLKCASPPIPSGSSFNGNILATAPVAFWDSSTTGGWWLPQGVIIQGTGLASQNGSGSTGFDIVACPGVIANLCPNAWPRDSVLTATISDNPNFNYNGADRDSGFYYVSIDCAYVQGCIGFQNHFAQENGGLYFSFVFGSSFNGIGIDLGMDYTSGNHQNSAIHNIEYADNNGPSGATINANTCGPGALAMRVSQANSGVVNGDASQQSIRLVQDSTFSHFYCGQTFTAPNSLIMYAEGGNSTFQANHYEYFGSNAIVVGQMEFMGSINTDGTGTSLTYQANSRGISMNPLGFTGGVAGGWPTAYTGTIFVFNGSSWVSGTISVACASVTACTTAASVGANLTNAPYFLYANSVNKNWSFAGSTAAATGAQNLVFDGVDACCSSGANSVIQIINTGTTTPTTKNIAIRNYRSHLPNVATNLIADAFNANVTTPGGGGGYASYVLDSSQRVNFDDSGFNLNKFRGPIGSVQGAKPAVSGCGASTLAGGNDVFLVTIGTGGAGCTLTITWTQTATVYVCQAADQTTTTVIPTYSAGSATTCLINLPATVVASDKIQVLAFAY